MKEYPLKPGVLPEIDGEILFLDCGWTIAEVLEWFAGKRCTGCADGYAINDPDTGRNLGCGKHDFADPPAEYGRDVLVAYIMAGGATHQRHGEMAREAKKTGIVRTENGFMGHGTLRDFWLIYPEEKFVPWTAQRCYSIESARLAMKRRILRLFSGPVEEGGVRISCPDCGGIGTCPRESPWTACMRCKQHGEIVPEKLLPPEQAPITVPTEPDWDEIADYD